MVLLLVVTAEPAVARAPAPDDGARAMSVMTPAAAVAARTDRRPVAGGLYDAVAHRTFISWAGVHEDNFVQAYDHRTGTWSAPVKTGGGLDDSHNYPTMVQARDGHLLVFHNLHNTQLFVARSPLPHSIEGTWTEQVIAEGDGATYPMPFVADDGAVFVFVRETVRDLDKVSPVDLRPMKYVRSTDNGLTWSNTAQLTGDKYAIAPTDRPDNMNEIYIGQLRHVPAGRGQPERVLIVYTLAGGGVEGHLHDRYHKNIYYTSFTPGDLHFHATDGRDLGTRVDDAEQEAYLKIADTPFQAAPYQRSPDYISLVGEVLPGIPFVLWMQLDATGVLHDFAAVRGPQGWRVTEVATGVRVRDMAPVGPLSWRVYASGEPAPGGVAPPGIRTYVLVAGFWWFAGPVIATPQAVQRVEVITHGRDPARILATGASSARDVSVADGDVYVAGFARHGEDD
ncbi:MAG: hypothetical protein AUI14_14370 [Actinobacteria bacterium 13_2_20CM_2_71_6]|nr:MAG: hypothetical protein AUI14_14370 [Actinobacteria bacterium 13_2_20CM_2_71_6]